MLMWVQHIRFATLLLAIAAVLLLLRIFAG